MSLTDASNHAPDIDTRTVLPTDQSIDAARRDKIEHSQPVTKSPIPTTAGTYQQTQNDDINEELRRMFGEAMKVGDDTGGAVYYECRAGDGTTQINGNSVILDGHDKSLNPPCVKFKGKTTHVNPTKEGNGLQINGNLVLSNHSLGGKEPIAERQEITWVAPVCDPKAEQINGDVTGVRK